MCNYCGGAFCADHRLPESHMCKGDLTLKRTIAAPATTTFSWQTPSTTTPNPTTRQAKVFSFIEVRDIVIAWLALGIAFSLSVASRGSLFGSGTFNTTAFVYYLALALLTVGPGFVFHELSHKFVAQRYGFWAEFRMWPMGLLLALLTSLLGFIFAAPGATYISGSNISQPENGKISVAGPAINVVIAALFLPFAFFGTGFLADLGNFGTYINLFLALFNLLPIGPLDGAKVWRWNRLTWAAAFVPLALVFYYFFFG
ncbi:MAG: site-2 protease family protein [Thaumarchaeota archaeon]|nr:site-2 protease family protein [Nitrososphaerota archaeon]